LRRDALGDDAPSSPASSDRKLPVVALPDGAVVRAARGDGDTRPRSRKSRGGCHVVLTRLSTRHEIERKVVASAKGIDGRI